MKKIVFLLIAAALAFGCAKKESKPGRWNADTSTWSATVVAVDHTTRFATLKDQAGNEITFRVNDDIQNLDKVAPGDIVDVETVEAYAIFVRKATEAPQLQVNSETEYGLVDGLPAKTVVTSVEATGLVKAVDYSARTLMLQNPDGQTVKINVPDAVKNLRQIKVGDEIVTRYSQNSVYSMRKR